MEILKEVISKKEDFETIDVNFDAFKKSIKNK